MKIAIVNGEKGYFLFRKILKFAEVKFFTRGNISKYQFMSIAKISSKFDLNNAKVDFALVTPEIFLNFLAEPAEIKEKLKNIYDSESIDVLPDKLKDFLNYEYLLHKISSEQRENLYNITSLKTSIFSPPDVNGEKFDLLFYIKENEDKKTKYQSVRIRNIKYNLNFEIPSAFPTDGAFYEKNFYGWYHVDVERRGIEFFIVGDENPAITSYFIERGNIAFSNTFYIPAEFNVKKIGKRAYEIYLSLGGYSGNSYKKLVQIICKYFKKEEKNNCLKSFTD